MTGRPWYLQGRMRHTEVSAAVTLGFILLELVRGPGPAAGAAMPSVPEMTTLAAVLAFFGVPHGATDHLVAASIFRRSFPRTWLLVFVVTYLAMMGAVVLCWKVAPVFSLASFLLMSVVHWGLGDAEEDLLPTQLLAVEVCVRGCIPILLPCVAFRAHVSSIFSWLVGPESDPGRIDDILAWARLAMGPFLLALAACIAYHAFAAWGWWGGTGRRSWIAAGCHSVPLPHQKTRHAHTVGELLLLPALASTCPPLVSFMIYFCLWHSVRHILCVSSSTFDALRWQRALFNFALHALPFSAATLALAGVVWHRNAKQPPSYMPPPPAGAPSPATSNDSDDWSADMPALAQIIFIGLNAVTVPHMIVTEISRVRQRAAETTRGESGAPPGGDGGSSGSGAWRGGKEMSLL